VSSVSCKGGEDQGLSLLNFGTHGPSAALLAFARCVDLGFDRASGGHRSLHCQDKLKPSWLFGRGAVPVRKGLLLRVVC
jgi:hypothetical protein